jgi:T5SS/PEP-CTERM-associated repeat protein/autotransporter-associated beta strand protein
MCRSQLLAATLLLTSSALVASPSFATITTTGDVAGTGTPYAGQDPWNAQNLIIGNAAPGSMSIKNGSVVNDTTNGLLNRGFIAHTAAASTSSVLVDGTGSAWNTSGVIFVGENGNGTLDITGGGSVNTAGAGMGLNTDSSGTLNVGGGSGLSTLNSSKGNRVGSNGTGALNVTGGGSVNVFSPGGFFEIGPFGSGSGTVTVGGGIGVSTVSVPQGSITVGGDVDGGEGGVGVLNINTGGTVSAASLNIGGNAGTIVNFDGGTLSTPNIFENTPFPYVPGTLSGLFNLKAGGSTIEIPSASDATGILSNIAGAGALTKTGAGTLYLQGANVYSGNTNVNGGRWRLPVWAHLPTAQGSRSPAGRRWM